MIYILLRSLFQFLPVGILDNEYKGQFFNLVPRLSLDLHSNPEIFSDPWPVWYECVYRPRPVRGALNQPDLCWVNPECHTVGQGGSRSPTGKWGIRRLTLRRGAAATFHTSSEDMYASLQKKKVDLSQPSTWS